jgi:hypothetical protein
VQAIRSPDRKDDQPRAEADQQRTGRLLVTGIALSIDNLAVGFALGTTVPVHSVPPSSVFSLVMASRRVRARCADPERPQRRGRNAAHWPGLTARARPKARLEAHAANLTSMV